MHYEDKNTNKCMYYMSDVNTTNLNTPLWSQNNKDQ